MYVIFYICCKLCHNYNLIPVAIFVFILIISLALKCSGAHVMWYYSNMAFPIGALISVYKVNVDKILKTRYTLCLILAICLFTYLSFMDRILGFNLELINVVEVRHFCRMISTSVFGLLVVIIMSRLKCIKHLWYFIGKHSLEIYLLHAPLYFLLRSKIVYINDSFFYVLTTVLISILIAIPVKHLNIKLNNLIRF